MGRQQLGLAVSLDLIDNIALRECLRDTHKILGFASLVQVAEAINRIDPTIDKSRAQAYLHKQTVGNLPKLSKAAAKLLPDHLGKIEAFYLANGQDEQAKRIIKVVNNYLGLRSDARHRNHFKSADLPLRPLSGSNRDEKNQFDYWAQNYERVDFMSHAEVRLGRVDERQVRYIYAQVDFVKRLYVQSKVGRIEFGVRRAFIVVDNSGPGCLLPREELLGKGDRGARIQRLHDVPRGVAVCVEPGPADQSLKELALPPSRGENYLCNMASATVDVTLDHLRAEVRVSIDVEGLYLLDENNSLNILENKRKQIEAILAVVAAKNYDRIEHGLIRRSVEVTEKLEK